MQLTALLSKCSVHRYINCSQEPSVPEIDVLLSMEETLGLTDVFDDEFDAEQDVVDFESDWQAVQPRDFNK